MPSGDSRRPRPARVRTWWWRPRSARVGRCTSRWAPSRASRSWSGVPLGRGWWAGQYVRLATRRESRRLAGVAPDILHAHGEFNLDNLRVARLFRCPVVISPHGACHPVVLAKSRRLAKRAFLGTERVLLRHHRRAYHALSPAEADHVAAVFPDTPTYCVPQGPSTFVTAGVFPGGFVPSSSPQGVTFVFVGRLDVFTKGLDLLLEAFASTVHEAPGQAQSADTRRAGLERRVELAPATGDRTRDRGQGALHGSASRRECRGGARERGHLRAAFAARGLSPERRGSAAGAQAGRPQPSDRHDVVPGNRGAAPRPCGAAERRRGHPGDDGAGRRSAGTIAGGPMLGREARRFLQLGSYRSPAPGSVRATSGHLTDARPARCSAVS